MVLWQDGKKLKLKSDVELSPKFLNVIKKEKETLLSYLKQNNGEFIPPEIFFNDLNYYLASYSQVSYYLLLNYSINTPAEKVRVNIPIYEYEKCAIHKTILFIYQNLEVLRYRYLNENGIVKFSVDKPNNLTGIVKYYYTEETFQKEVQDFVNVKGNLNTGDELNTFFVLEQGSNSKVSIVINGSVFEGSNLRNFITDFVFIYDKIRNEQEVISSSLLGFDNKYKFYGFIELGYVLYHDGENRKLKDYKGKLLKSIKPFYKSEFPYPGKKFIELHSTYFENEMSSYLISENNRNDIKPGYRSKFEVQQGAEYTFKIKKDVIDEILSKCSSFVTTEYCVLVTVFSYVLRKRLVDFKSNVIVGNCLTNRDLFQMDTTIGFFTNIVFQEIEFNQSSFMETLEEFSSVFFSQMSLKFYPWEKLIKEIDLSPSKLDSIFLDYSVVDSKSPQIEDFKFDEGSVALFDHTCIINSYSDSVLFFITFSSKIFGENYCKNFIKDYMSFIEQISKNVNITEATLLDD